MRLLLGVFLIFGASAILLMSDRGRPPGKQGNDRSGLHSDDKVWSVALFQHVSQPTLDETARGVLAGLSASGYQDQKTIQLKRFNAEADSATSVAIANEIANGNFDLVITLTTPSLQAMATANKAAQVSHVFGAVSDPVAAGVGIKRADPLDHPSNMVGLGTMQPVAEAFQLARRLSPDLKRVGVAWNASEANSEACTRLARQVCGDLGIELIEANVENSAAVREAVASLISRGVEAIWIGGDVTVLAAVEAVLGPAQTAGIPVFSNIPGTAERGVLFDVGADYYQVGGRVGQIASQVLGGESPALMPVEYDAPPQFWLNEVALKAVRGQWSVPADVDAKADVKITASGVNRLHPFVEPKAVSPKRTKKAVSNANISLVLYNENVVVEETYAGFIEGLKEAGLIEGHNLSVKTRNAQGDIATLSAICDELNGDSSDLVVSLSTPALQAAIRKVDRKPLVFGLVLDPIAAGAGKTFEDHGSLVTGTYLDFPFDAVARSIQEIIPNAKRVGTLYTPGELNSVISRDRFTKALKGVNLELVSASITSASDVIEAVQNLNQSRIDVFFQISDSLCNASFPAISGACLGAKMPLFCFAPDQVKQGAVVAIGMDYRDHGRELGKLTSEVLSGINPGKIPFRGYSSLRKAVNLDNARRIGFNLPEKWVQQVDVVFPDKPSKNH